MMQTSPVAPLISHRSHLSSGYKRRRRTKDESPRTQEDTGIEEMGEGDGAVGRLSAQESSQVF